MMSRFSDFVVCSTNHYIWSSGVYILGLEHHLKLKLFMTIFMTILIIFFGGFSFVFRRCALLYNTSKDSILDTSTKNTRRLC